MSHFAVTVIGDNVEEQLAPYHEFECTGRADKYVQSIDRLEEAREAFAEHTEGRLKLPDGTLVDFFDDKGEWKPEYSQVDPADIMNSHNKRRTYFVPEGCEQVMVPAVQVTTFVEFCEGWYGYKAVAFDQAPDLEGEHKFGYVVVNSEGQVVQVVRRTNPNKKWDWYTVGGRWMGFFTLKTGAAGELGEPGVFGNRPKDDGADVLRKGDIDFDRMRTEAAAEAGKQWDAVRAAAGDLTGYRTWQQVRESCGDDIEKARKDYREQDAVKRVEAPRVLDSFFDSIDSYLCTREEYVDAARNRAGTTHAIVKDGVWYQRGDMGWWGMSSNEMPEAEWFAKYRAMIDALPDDTRVTLVDCHI